MDKIVIFVGVFKLSGAFNDLKYLGKVGDELYFKINIWGKKNI